MDDFWKMKKGDNQSGNSTILGVCRQWNRCYGSGGIFMFNPGLKIGQIIKNADIVGIILKAKILRRINISGVN